MWQSRGQGGEHTPRDAAKAGGDHTAPHPPSCPEPHLLENLQKSLPKIHLKFRILFLRKIVLLFSPEITSRPQRAKLSLLLKISEQIKVLRSVSSPVPSSYVGSGPSLHGGRGVPGTQACSLPEPLPQAQLNLTGLPGSEAERSPPLGRLPLVRCQERGRHGRESLCPRPHPTAFLSGM